MTGLLNVCESLFRPVTIEEFILKINSKRYLLFNRPLMEANDRKKTVVPFTWYVGSKIPLAVDVRDWTCFCLVEADGLTFMLLNAT